MSPGKKGESIWKTASRNAAECNGMNTMKRKRCIREPFSGFKQQLGADHTHTVEYSKHLSVLLNDVQHGLTLSVSIRETSSPIERGTEN